MMKIWCETCEGSGSIFVNMLIGKLYKEKCPACKGKGYTENIETERLAEIGRATEYLLNCRYPMALATKEQIRCTEGGIFITDVDNIIDLYNGLSNLDREV